jgi:hypothetical protein
MLQKAADSFFGGDSSDGNHGEIPFGVDLSI